MLFLSLCKQHMNRTTHIAALILLAVLASGQQTVTADKFRWDSASWQELSWKQSITRLRLAQTLKADLIETIVKQMQADESDHEHRTDKELRQIAAETRITFVDLTRRGRNEVIAQAGGEKSDCSPTGNCPLLGFAARARRI
jgi:hypothetical protein